MFGWFKREKPIADTLIATAKFITNWVGEGKTILETSTAFICFYENPVSKKRYVKIMGIENVGDSNRTNIKYAEEVWVSARVLPEFAQVISPDYPKQNNPEPPPNNVIRIK